MVRLQKQAVWLPPMSVCRLQNYRQQFTLKYALLRQIGTETDKVTPFLKVSVFTPFFAEN